MITTYEISTMDGSFIVHAPTLLDAVGLVANMKPDAVIVAAFIAGNVIDTVPAPAGNDIDGPDLFPETDSAGGASTPSAQDGPK